MKTAVVVTVRRTAVLQADRAHEHLLHVPTCADCHSLAQGRIVIWDAKALFGCAPKRPLDYSGSAGLLWAIKGGRLVELH
jgi:hypothetical protein